MSGTEQGRVRAAGNGWDRQQAPIPWRDLQAIVNSDYCSDCPGRQRSDTVRLTFNRISLRVLLRTECGQQG